MTLAKEGFPSSKTFETIADSLSKANDAERKDMLKKVNGIFEMRLTNSKKETVSYLLDFKKKGEVFEITKDSPKVKPDVTINLTDETFQKLADGSLNGQKAFMTGALKVKGNIMLATKLDTVLKNAKSKL